MEYRIAILSYHRAQALKDKTLDLLERNKIDSSLIDIFVADESERAEYESVLDANKYNKLIIGVLGCSAQHNFISKYYPEDTNVLQLDDDISEIITRVSSKKIKPVKNLDLIIREGFQIARQQGCYLWGVYPVKNPYFMSRKIVVGLKYIEGAFFGIINRHDADIVLDEKVVASRDDMERSLQYFVKDGKVLRFEYLSFITVFWGGAGGLQDWRTRENEEIAVQYLVDKYPLYCERDPKLKRGKHPDIRLKKIK